MKIKGRTTLKTLAKASGVSVATASQVIRGVGRISEHTRKRVLSTAEKMNYIPDGRAISMRSGERPEIGSSSSRRSIVWLIDSSCNQSIH